MNQFSIMQKVIVNKKLGQKFCTGKYLRPNQDENRHRLAHSKFLVIHNFLIKYQNLTSNMSKFNNWVILCKSYILPNYTFCYLFIYKFVNEQLFDSKTYFFLPISLPNLLKFLLRKVVWLLVSAGYFFLIFCGLYHFCEVFKFLEKMGHFVHFLFKTWTWSNKLIKLKNKEF